MLSRGAPSEARDAADALLRLRASIRPPAHPSCLICSRDLPSLPTTVASPQGAQAPANDWVRLGLMHVRTSRTSQSAPSPRSPTPTLARTTQARLSLTINYPTRTPPFSIKHAAPMSLHIDQRSAHLAPNPPMHMHGICIALGPAVCTVAIDRQRTHWS